jgi:uroporphyrinogen decarboxylase
MNPRTLVKQSLTFSSPKRIPRDLWTLPWAAEHYPAQLAEIRSQFPGDLVGAPGFLRVQPHTQGEQYSIGEYIDEWGCIFENRQRGVIGEVKKPLVATWEDLSLLLPPEEFLTIDKEQINAFCKSSDYFVTGGCCPRPFERLQFIRGSENLYIDLAEQPPELFTLIKRIHEFYMKELEQWVQTDVDAVNFMDDWGAQHALLISPRQWRKIFKPLYKEYIDLAHQHGKFIFMHSDGYTRDIIPDLIELGLDAINTQIFTMDIEELGRSFAGKLTFWGEIDRQYLLSFGTTADIEKAVHRVKDSLYCNGGIIAQCEFGAGSKPENVYQVYQSWNEVGGNSPDVQ